MRRSSNASLALLGTAIAATAAALALTRALLATPPPENAVVLITGGSRGLGFAVASRFAQRPVNLILAARNFDELQQAQQSLLEKHPHLRPENFYLVPADLSKPEECQRMINEAFSRFGRIDVLVNNAGIIEVGPIEAMTADMFERTMRINFLAAMQTTWAALPRLLSQSPAPGWKRRATVVNISSIGGKIAVPHMLPYTAAKFALTGFSEGLYAELKGKGIHVVTVCPGLMRTGGEDHAHFHGDVEAEEAWFKFCAKTPGISTTVEHASNKIFNAVAQARTEITITPQAYLGTRYAGLFPGGLQWLNRLTNDYILPKA
ncbi:MAG TPA: SDR family NAD(P)-dependent oxidoreductase [Acidobacteriaceae bacterium]|nr:SDR family NAD(P)-dependent oxidoreductase [Acidobacteriaceae bacterium]